MRVAVGKKTPDLTATEFQLLTALARQPGRIFTRAQLLDQIRGVAFESYERAIDAHIKNIRRKIEPNPLTIARNLVAAHGGEISADSTGAGTTIRFAVPVGPQP